MRRDIIDCHCGDTPLSHKIWSQSILHGVGLHICMCFRDVPLITTGPLSHGRAAAGVLSAMSVMLPTSSMHVTGEQLGQLTGIAAVLRFPLPEMEDDDDDDSDEVGCGGVHQTIILEYPQYDTI